MLVNIVNCFSWLMRSARFGAGKLILVKPDPVEVSSRRYTAVLLPFAKISRERSI